MSNMPIIHEDSGDERSSESSPFQSPPGGSSPSPSGRMRYHIANTLMESPERIQPSRVRLRETKSFLAPANRRLFGVPGASSLPQTGTSWVPTPAMEHWKAQLIDRSPSIPVFPFTKRGFRFHKAPPSFHFHDLAVSPALSFNIRFLCQNNEYSEVDFGLAALQVLLVQLTETDDFVIGLGRILGARRDIMPVRFKCDPAHTSQQLLEQTVETMQDTKIYLYEPLKVLLAELGASTETPLHQVTFNWLLSGQPAEGSTDMYFQHAQDLVLLVKEDDDRNLVVSVGLDQTTYDEEFAKVVAELYVSAMEEVVADSDTSISEMDLLDPEERQSSMMPGAGPVVESSSNGVVQKLQEVAARIPDHIAAKDQHGQELLTYEQLVRRAVAISSDLLSYGIVRGTAVCVLGPPTLDLLCSIIAIWCAGCIYVPIDNLASLEDSYAIAKHFETEFCVVSRPELIPYACLLGLNNAFYCGDMEFNNDFEKIDKSLPSDLAAALHVPMSGTTSRSVLLSHGNIETLITSIAYNFDEENQVVLQHSNWTSELALFQILFALTSGSTLVLATRLEEADVPKVMAQEKVTVTVATPSEYSAWFRQPLNMLRECNSWKFAIISGENVSSSVVRHFAALGNNNLELINMYGATETSVACCMGSVDYNEYVDDTDGKLIPVGRALPNYQIWVADSLGRALPPGWTGDIWVTGSGVIGDYPASEADNHRIQLHPDTEMRCFWTGDRGFLNDYEEGVLFVIFRQSFESATYVKGHYVQLGDISRAIVDKSMGRVAEAAVVLSKGTEQKEPQLQAFIIMSDTPDGESQQYLQSMLRSLALPTYMRPACAVMLETMPRTLVGKIDRHALMDMVVPDNEVVMV
ncbi:AMP-binding enzyme [Pyrenophora tritici-repentis]|uniref:AMP-binding enzyme n=1 Tax=Pyrenophora tritici-repentis TaxID=45151 RepID=A0A922NK39_9PLEO|nr:AMP-binding enzyme [Pyrenophora tritici-repentis]